MGTGEHATWNNEADAFKHAYMQWYLYWYHGKNAAIMAGNFHENETPNAPAGERNMDLWNNEIGREIAKEMKNQQIDWDIINEDTIREIVSKRIVDKMKAGELITKPDDPRKYENMKIER